MTHYIDADKLKKIVEQAKQRALRGAEIDEDMYCDGRADAFGEVLLEIDSLHQEQPEVDLEKEMEKLGERWPYPVSFNGYDKVWVDELVGECAKRFYELGLNARKEDK